MNEKPSPNGPDGSDAASELSPMDRFTDLARRLVHIPPEKVDEEKARYDEAEERRQRPRLTNNCTWIGCSGQSEGEATWRSATTSSATPASITSLES